MSTQKGKLVSALMISTAVGACSKQYDVNPQAVQEHEYISELHYGVKDEVAGEKPPQAGKKNKSARGNQSKNKTSDNSNENPANKTTPSRNKAKGNFLTQGVSFRAQALSSSNDPTNPTLALSYLKSGISVGNHYCGIFFDKNREIKVQRDALRGTLNISNGIATAVLGLANASNGVISGTGLAFTSAIAFIENNDLHYLISPELEKVENLVNKAQDVLYDELVEDKPPQDFYDADRYLRKYLDLCDFNAIKRLIGESVTKGEPKLIEHSTEAIDQVAARRIYAKVDQLSEQLVEGVSSLTNDQLVPIYTYFFKEPKSEYVSAAIEGSLKGSLKKDGADWQELLKSNALFAKNTIREVEDFYDLDALSTNWMKAVNDKANAEMEKSKEKTTPEMAVTTMGVAADTDIEDIKKQAIIASMKKGERIPGIPKKRRGTRGSVVQIQ